MKYHFGEADTGRDILPAILDENDEIVSMCFEKEMAEKIIELLNNGSN